MKNTALLSACGRWLLLLLAAILSGPLAQAQAPAWQTALTVSQSGGEYSAVTATATDASGNVFLTGYFGRGQFSGGTVTFGSTTLTSLTAPNQLSGADIFVAKWNPASGFVWAVRAGGTLDDRPAAIALQGNDIFIAGNFFSVTAGFGPATISNADVNGGQDAFVAKLTDNGSSASFRWAQAAGGLNLDFARGVAVSGPNVYITGWFGSTTATFGNLTLTSRGDDDVFVAKLTDAGASGSFVWVQQGGNQGRDEAMGIAASGTSVYVVGYFRSTTAIFGAIVLEAPRMFNIPYQHADDIFIAKLTDAGATGSFVWAQRAGGATNDYANAVAVIGTSVYVAGSFSSGGSGAFGVVDTTFGPLVLTSAGGLDLYVAKLTDAGSTSSFAWVQRAGGTANDGPGESGPLTLAARGSSVYTTGGFGSPTADFGATNLSRANYADIFVAKLTDAGTAGNFAWALPASSLGSPFSSSLALGNGRVYVAGGLGNGGFGAAQGTFGALSVPNQTNGSDLAYLAYFADNTLLATTAPAARATLSLWPNPARDAATARLPAGADAVLLDNQGRAVRRYPAPTAGTTDVPLDLHGLPAGLYLLRAAGSTQRLVVE
ncbi:MAG: T9SS type A sorting domain-containing protein [Bacteroidota bacterium]|nr:T9SS type A sorting domain-containing protein [Bacteroidota bacterium]